jgi:NADPH2:quinone reductase
MRALLCKSLGELAALAVAEVAVPTVGRRDVLVRVHACGLNFPDLLMVQGKYQRRPPLPFSPGCEFSGTVEGVGGDVHGFEHGDRVCGTADCGGLAEFIAVNVEEIYAVPPAVDLDVAAAYLYTYATSLYALRDRGALAAGNSLLVLGAGGGVGIAAVELGKALGARVVAAASTEAKLSLARSKGADQTISYPADLSDPGQQRAFAGRLKDLAGEGGFDVICDPVGGPYSEAALRSIGWAGRHLVIGFAAGAIPSVPFNLPLLKGCQIVGVSWGGAKMRDRSIMGRIQQELQRWLIDGRIRPHIAATFDLAHSIDGLKMLAERRAVGKVLVRC